MLSSAIKFSQFIPKEVYEDQSGELGCEYSGLEG